MKTNVTIILTAFALIGSNSAGAQGLKDVEICENIKNITARDAANALENGCSSAGVDIEVKRLRAWVFERLQPKHLPTKLECLSSCAVLDAFEDMEMSECVVQVHVKPFTEGMVNSIDFNAATCEAIDQQAN